MGGLVATMSVELLVVILFAIINLQLQIRFIAAIWGKGCNWSQLLDVYDLGDKYRKWMAFDLIANSLLMICATAFISSLGWSFSPISVGLFGIEALALICFPVRFVGAKIAMQNNPNLLDFNGKYKNTCDEF